MSITPKEGRYHHGHLRRALLDTALQLITERGVHSFTLREVARQAGVSHAAPYHHFADKSALIEALTVEGFESLTAVLHATALNRESGALEQLLAIGKAYVCFALEHRASFRLMFGLEVRPSTIPLPPEAASVQSPIERAGLAAYQVLFDSIVACQQTGVIVAGDPTPLALTAWSTVHGLAILLLDGALNSIIPAPESPDALGQVAEIVTRTLAAGLLVQ